MYATATIELDRRRGVLTVPASAVIRENEQSLCCVVVENKIERRPIQLGLRSGNEIEVVSGVGEKISSSRLSHVSMPVARPSK